MKFSILPLLLWATPNAATSPSHLPATCEDFNSGVYHGVDVGEWLWQQNGSSCSSIWGFEDQVDDYLDENYPTDTSNWRTNSCNEGVAEGANQVVEKYEKQCLDDSPDECNDLGNAAAQQIAFAFCPFNAASGTSAAAPPDYKKSCREVAYGICEGAIYNQVKSNGCSMTTSQLQQEQKKCKSQVDSMTGGEFLAKITRMLRKN